MVLGYQVQEDSRLLLYGRIQLLSVPGLVYLTYGTPEGLVLLVAEQGAFSELGFQAVYDLHRIFISSMEGLAPGRVANLQTL